MDSSNQCTICKKIFSYPFGLKRHLFYNKKKCKTSDTKQNEIKIIKQNLESSFEPPEYLISEDNFQCIYCHKDFSSKYTLYKHINKFCYCLPPKVKNYLEAKRNRKVNKNLAKSNISISTQVAKTSNIITLSSDNLDNQLSIANIPPSSITNNEIQNDLILANTKIIKPLINNSSSNANVETKSLNSITRQTTNENKEHINNYDLKLEGDNYFINDKKLDLVKITRLNFQKKESLMYIRSIFPEIQYPLGQEDISHINLSSKIVLFKLDPETAFINLIKLKIVVYF